MSDTLGYNNAAVVLTASRLGVYVELTKPRISALVLLTTAVGFYLAIPSAPDFAIILKMIHTLVGTALVAAGANALNQYLEAEHDGNMVRTARRPLPSGRVAPSDVLAFGTGAGITGVAYLVLLVNVSAALLAGLTLVFYVLLYTPLKRVTPMSVFVGAIPGALPPVIGWAGASGAVTREGALLFGILYFWQLPHFASIAWLYRSDYEKAGYPTLVSSDPSGTRMNVHVMTHSVGLLAASVLLTLHQLTGTVYAIGAMALGLAFLHCGMRFVACKTPERARVLLLASVLYLGLLFALMMFDKVGPQ